MFNLVRRGIVHRWVQRRSPFDKTNYVDHWIPSNIPKNPRQAKWDDPEYNWPPLYEKPTKYQGRHLLDQLEAEYKEELLKTRSFPEFHTGDLLELQVYYSLSGQQYSTFVGLCIANYDRNNVNHAFNVIGNTGGSPMEIHMKLYSPMIKSLRILEKGSGKMWKRLNKYRTMPMKTYGALNKVNMKKYVQEAIDEEKRLRYKLLVEDGYKVEE